MVIKGKHLWDKIRNNKVFANLSVLLTGNIIAVLIPLLVSPILTRIFTENDFGLFTTYNAIIAISLSISTGRLDYAIIEAKNKSITSHLFLLSITIAFITSIIGFIMGYFLFPLIEDVKQSIVAVLLILIPLMIFINSFSQVCQYVLNRSDRYAGLSIIKTIRSISTGAIHVTGEYVFPISSTLIIGKAIGNIIAFFLSIWFVVKNKLIEIKPRKYKFKYILSKYNKYYSINSFHALFNTISANLLPLLFVGLFTVKEVGYYGLSARVCYLPIAVISHAIFQFFSREFAKKIEAGEPTKNMFVRAIHNLLLVSIPPFIFLILFGPQLFGIIFGENWTEAGRYAQILAPYMLTVFLVSPFVFVPIRLNYHFKSFSIEVLNTILRIVAIVIGSKFGVLTAITMYSITGLMVQCYMLIWIYNLLKKNDN